MHIEDVELPPTTSSMTLNSGDVRFLVALVSFLFDFTFRKKKKGN